jgi:hypothetical protein
MARKNPPPAAESMCQILNRRLRADSSPSKAVTAELGPTLTDPLQPAASTLPGDRSRQSVPVNVNAATMVAS